MGSLFARAFRHGTFWPWLVLAALPLSTRLGSRDTPLLQFISGFDEYHALFLYASDIVIAALIVWTFFRGRGELRRFFFGDRIGISIGVFLLLAFGSVFFAPSVPLALYAFSRLFFAVLFAWSISVFLREPRSLERILVALAVVAVFQSLVGLFQFRAQGAIGLSLLGESPISITDPGTSKIAIGALKFVRAYGTFPHPNIYAAFLLLGLLSLFHFYLHTMQGRDTYAGRRILISLGIFFVSIGLALSFSRAAWLIGFLATFPFVLYGFLQEKKAVSQAAPEERRMPLSRFWFQDNTRTPSRATSPERIRSLRLLTLFLVVNYFIVAMFGWAVFPRASLSTREPAVTYRVAYLNLGNDLLREKPFGVGIGSQILYAYRHGFYERLGMTQKWEWAPIHNLYLLIAVELGIPALLLFAALLLFLFRNILRDVTPLERLTAVVMLGSIAALGLFDHFFWTIEQGRLMLWLAMGFALGIASRPREAAHESP